MAKWKKRRPGKRAPKRPSAKTLQKIDAAMELYDEGEIDLALRQLRDLADRFPHSQDVLFALLQIYHELQDWSHFVQYSERLLPLQKGLERADMLNNLVYSYLQLQYPALGWHYAQEFLTRHPGDERAASIAGLAQKLEATLIGEMPLSPSMEEFSDDQKLAVAVQHDQLRFYTETGRAEEAIDAANALLAQTPDLTPASNNLSLAYYSLGKIDEAIAVAQKVLVQDDDNFHALANLARFSFLSGRFDEAETYKQRLQKIRNDYPDLPAKKAEIFAFMGEDEQVWAAYKQAKARGDSINPLLLHLAAAAAYRMGNEKQAWKLWRQAVAQSPGFYMAKRSLDEKRLPAGQRNVPWYWPLQYWFPKDLIKLLDRYTSRGDIDASGAAQMMEDLLTEQPYLPQLFPHMLELGDHTTRDFVVSFIESAGNPELAPILYEFARGRQGDDQLRMRAIQYITQRHPHLLPEDKMVKMWFEGEQREIFMLGFNITDEPSPAEDLPKDIQQKYQTAYEFLIEETPEKAEPLLQEIIAAAPDFPPAQNHLALVYERTGRKQESRELVKKIFERFPDYFLGRIAMARIWLSEGKIEEARELLNQALRVTDLHVSEFRALAMAHIDLALFDKKPERARGWLEMWQQIEPDHPQLDEWEKRVEGQANMQDLLGKLRNAAGKRKKRPRRR